MKNNISERNYFAGLAMQAIIIKTGIGDATRSYQIADEMIKASGSQQPEKHELESTPQTFEDLKDIVEYLELEILLDNKATFCFVYEGQRVYYYKNKKWFSGKSVKDGRGAENLIKQLKRE